MECSECGEDLPVFLIVNMLDSKLNDWLMFHFCSKGCALAFIKDRIEEVEK